MNAVNFMVFLGLSAAGLALLAGYTGLAPTSSVPKLFAFGTTIGWLFSVMSVGLYVAGALAHLLGKMPTFWKRLFSVNLGVTVLGVTFLSFRTDLWALWLTGFVAGAALALISRQLAALPWRPLVIVALLPLVALQVIVGTGPVTVIQVMMGAFLIFIVPLVARRPAHDGGGALRS